MCTLNSSPQGFPQETGMDLKLNVIILDLVDLAH